MNPWIVSLAQSLNLAMRGVTLSSKKLTITCINPLSDWRLISAYYITPESNMKDMRILRGDDHQVKQLLIVEQILLVSLIGNVWRTV